MPLPFDATLKDLVQTYPHDWLAVLDAPTAGPVSVLTPDLSTLTAFADAVLRTGDSLVHIDFQSGPAADLSRRLLLYNVLLHDQYGLPVHSVAMLLRPKADHPKLTGVVRYEGRPGRGGLEFRYEAVRLWQVPVDTLLASGLGTLPLAPLGRLPRGKAADRALRRVIDRLAERARKEAAPEQAAILLTAAYVLTGMRLSQERALQLFQGVQNMRDSTTYQAILDEGRAEGLAKGRIEEARKLLLRLGRKHLGAPDATTEAALQAIADLERLERMSDRLLEVATWQDLLATP